MQPRSAKFLILQFASLWQAVFFDDGVARSGIPERNHRKFQLSFTSQCPSADSRQPISFSISTGFPRNANAPAFIALLRVRSSL